MNQILGHDFVGEGDVSAVPELFGEPSHDLFVVALPGHASPPVGAPAHSSTEWSARIPVAPVASDAVVILPRLARALNAPAVAAVIGLILIAVGIFGLATDDIPTGYAIVILIVGLINLVRTMAPRNGD